MDSANLTTAERNRLEAKVVLSALERYVFDHLREPSTPEDKERAEVLREVTYSLTQIVHAPKLKPDEPIDFEPFNPFTEIDQDAATTEADATSAKADPAVPVMELTPGTAVGTTAVETGTATDVGTN